LGVGWFVVSKAPEAKVREKVMDDWSEPPARDMGKSSGWQSYF